jgi:hypothetical protein
MRPNITVTVAASSRSLVQRADVKTELGITGSGSDAQLDRLIVAASLAMAGAEGLRREPWLQTYSEKYSGPGGHYALLSRWPIQTVSSVTEGTGSSPTTVDSDTYSVAGNARRDRLYRVNGWTLGSESTPRSFTDEDGPDLIYTATYTAGWVMPDQLTEWAATTAFAANSWGKATDLDEPFIFQSGGGTSGAAEPTWPTVQAGTVTDNDFDWTAYDQRLPQDLEEAAMIQVIDWFRGGLQAPTNIMEESFEGHRIVYGKTLGGELSPAAKSICLAHR